MNGDMRSVHDPKSDYTNRSLSNAFSAVYSKQYLQVQSCNTVIFLRIYVNHFLPLMAA